MYAKDTLDVLLQALADDLEMLFKQGLQVTCLPRLFTDIYCNVEPVTWLHRSQVRCQQTVINVKVAMIGVKGDWPFMKKSMHLRTGYTSKRICHLCDAKDWVKNSLACTYAVPFDFNGTTDLYRSCKVYLHRYI